MEKPVFSKYYNIVIFPLYTHISSVVLDALYRPADLRS